MTKITTKKEKPLKIGIMGGTFNPIHFGHLLIAEQLRELIKADKVLFIPCSIPPHKTKKELTEKKHRFHMVELAVENNPYFEACDIEIKQDKKSYTIDTIKELTKIYKSSSFYFFIGEDNLLELSTWKEIKKLMSLCSLVIARRFLSPQELNYLFKEKNKFFDDNTVNKLTNSIVDTTVIDISSSEIRQKIVNNKSIKYLVPDKIAEYIKKNRLYRGNQ